MFHLDKVGMGVLKCCEENDRGYLPYKSQHVVHGSLAKPSKDRKEINLLICSNATLCQTIAQKI